MCSSSGASEDLGGQKFRNLEAQGKETKKSRLYFYTITLCVICNGCIKTCGEWMERECSVDSSSLENGFHNEVVRSVDPEGVIAEPLTEDAVPL